MTFLLLLWKILKYPLLLIGILVIAVLVLGLFGKKEMKAEREIVINKPKAVVYDYIK